LADIIEPAYLIGGAQLLASVGAVVCGASKSLSIGCFGRFLVGLGCGPTYVPVCRCILNWFPLKLYPHMSGVLLAFGGAGAIAAQGPLALLAKAIGWRWCFFGVGGVGAILSIICLIFTRGNPVVYGYPPVNKDLARIDTGLTCKDRFHMLISNFKVVIKFKFFWIIVVYCMFCNGPYFDVTGMWVAPWLQDLFGFSTQASGNVAIALSIGLISGSLLIPPVSSLVHSRKWVIFACTCTAFIVSLCFLLIEPSKLNYAALYAMLILFGGTTNSMTAVAYPLVREYYHPAVAATSVGCVNIFTFLSSAIFQTLTSEIIKNYGFQDHSDSAYTAKGYKIALWLVCVIAFAIATIAIGLAKDTVFAKSQADDTEEEVHEDVEHHVDETAPHGHEKEECGSDLGEL
jgi:sugar phosphate permease